MFKCFYFLIFFYTSLFFNCFSQQMNIKKTFQDGQYFYDLGVYSEAYYNFYQVWQHGQQANYNVNYLVGLSLFNFNGRKVEAIPYFEKAIENTTLDYLEGSYNEKNAYIDAFFYLGRAYQIKMKLNEANLMFEKYLKLLPSAFITEKKYTQKEIDATKNLIEALKKPDNYYIEKLQNVNNEMRNIKAIVSGNDSVLIYTSEEKLTNFIVQSKKTKDGKWSNIEVITPQLKVDDNYYPVSISYHADKLVLVKDDAFNSDLYFSDLVNGKWTPVKKFPDPINSKFWESHGCFSMDKKKFYFTSNRTGGIGSLDIYVSELDQNNKWSSPINLGSYVNSPFNEDALFLSQHDSVLFFSSQGHINNLGGYDIFFSNHTDTGFSSPVNLGYPFNTPDDELFFSPVANGNAGYISVYSGVMNMDDIHYVKLHYKPSEQKYEKLAVNTDHVKNTKKIVEAKTEIASNIKVEKELNAIKSQSTTQNQIKDHSQPQLQPINQDSTKYYYIQLLATHCPVDTLQFFKPLKKIKEHLCGDGIYRYTVYSYKKLDDALAMRENIVRMGFKDAFIVNSQVLNQKKQGVTEELAMAPQGTFFTVQFYASVEPISLTRFVNLKKVRRVKLPGSGLNCYVTGQFEYIEPARQWLSEVLKKGYKDSFITPISKQILINSAE